MMVWYTNKADCAFIILYPPLLSQPAKTLLPQRPWTWCFICIKVFPPPSHPSYPCGSLSHSVLCSMSAPQRDFSSIPYIKSISLCPLPRFCLVYFLELNTSWQCIYVALMIGLHLSQALEYKFHEERDIFPKHTKQCLVDTCAHLSMCGPLGKHTSVKTHRIFTNVIKYLFLSLSQCMPNICSHSYWGNVLKY